MNVKDLLVFLQASDPDTPIVVKVYEQRSTEPLLSHATIRDIREGREGALILEVEQE